MRHMLMLVLLCRLAAPLAAQAIPDTTSATAVTRAHEDAVLAAVDSVPATVAALAARTGLSLPVVRVAILRAWDRREVRYRLVPRPDGDTTASGRPRRERAYYRPPSPR